ncbi:hypothetical protein OEM_30830 [Mycobacterium intracellulare subsp. yongonense 05-1390]|nr:hypothetical protein OEM_30830 [Mycobacterium intracellulare subsp. yongonense 05-1390]ARR78747.1 hypothetical protein MOTT12_03083 [Mycobacterium intracellulare subsp. yongonense]ARR83819.1 hypothetical protein MOTT27_02998 [Mycobacterium intracellulare subsp. yongonense]KEF95565.1 hypothetical protein K883_04875 [Mycobacterium sp. TKK-01-0059]
MRAASLKPRPTQIAIGAVIAFIALCVAMCDSPRDTSGSSAPPTVTAVPPSAAPSAAPPPAPPPPPVGKDYVEGMVQSVSGGTIALRTRTGSASVDYTPETRVVQVTPAKLADVTPGSCVNVRATPQSAPTPGTVTAQSVTVTASADGKCPPPAGFYGTVASVSGNTITVTGLGPGGPGAPATVTVTDSTSYQRQTPSDAQAITNGKCLGANGTQDGGVLHAAMISLETCPPMGHPHHHLHLPHLPFHL